MSDQEENQGNEVEGSEKVDNLKQEVNRKLQNQNDAIDRLSTMTESILNRFQQEDLASVQQKQAIEDEDADWDLNPKTAAAKMKRELKAEMRRDTEASINSQQRQASVLAEVTAMYPELTDNSSEMHKRTVALHNRYSDTVRNQPESIKLAAMEAANELGAIPASRRNDQDDYVMSGKGSNNQGNHPPKKRPNKDEIAEDTLDVGRLLGIDVDDPEVQKRVKEYQRRAWGKYR